MDLMDTGVKMFNQDDKTLLFSNQKDWEGI